jgi:phosphoribosylformylglycinamidine (FGAM) synthase PurS component
VELDAPDAAAAQVLLAELCKKLLANPVIEDFEIVSVE